MTSEFQYQPLASDGEIRVIDLLPGPFGDPSIHCRIRHVNVTKAASTYDALSYRWGDSAPTQNIFCDENNAQLQVPFNTYNAMRYLRDPDKVRTVWIDAVCINQADTEEKNAQVQLMVFIYLCSSRTVVFLGNSTPGSRLLFQYLNQADDEQRRYQQLGRENPIFHLEPPPQQIIRELELLFRMEWFSRIWVIQELYNAPSAVFMCGHDYATSDILQGCLYGFKSNTRQIVDFPVPLAINDDHSRSNINDSPTGIQRLFTLAAKTGLSESSDDRDRIIALTPFVMSTLINGAQTPGTNVVGSMQDLRDLIDYTEEVEEIYHQFALKVLRDAGLGLLWMVRHPHSRAMPSWVPDWSQHTHRSFSHSELPIYFASAECSESCNEIRTEDSHASGSSHSLTPQSLIVKGSRCGRIREFGPLIQIDEESNETRIRDVTSLLDGLDSMRCGDDGPQYSEWPGSIKRALRDFDEREDIYDLLRSKYLTHELEREIGEPLLNHLASMIAMANQGCRVFITDEGVLGVAPGEAQEGDLICVIKGTIEVCILRERNHNQWEIISGDCFFYEVAIRYGGDEEHWTCINEFLESRQLEEFTII
ncbi:hypothetical protein NUW58_g4476 [Xylaria curta]|uniref:Uncharacterized protein n=1 Tax=Xylaria curta TaxID=42375 RepID=A0ACC1P6P7_9PEZI|nr:hypothetical protein NUW58_g4476 [Xylaria curta]